MKRTFVLSLGLLTCSLLATYLAAQTPYANAPTYPGLQPATSAPLNPNDANTRLDTLSNAYTVNQYGAVANHYATAIQYSNKKNYFVYRDAGTGKLIAKPQEELTPDLEKQASEHANKTLKAFSTLRSPKSSQQEREDARKLVSEELDVQFEIDLKERREQLKTIENQLEELRQHVKQREASKSKLIELRILLMENESTGLGFPATWTQTPSVYTSRDNLYYYVQPAANYPVPVEVPKLNTPEKP